MDVIIGIAVGFIFGFYTAWECYLSGEKEKPESSIRADEIGSMRIRRSQHFADVKYDEKQKPHIIYRQ